MPARNVARWTTDRGLVSSGVAAAICLGFSGVMSFAQLAAADPSMTVPDPPPRRAPPVVGPSKLGSSENLDGVHVWLGPVGAASRVDAAWDTTFGADLSIVRVREGAALGVVGASAGASRWSERGGGRIWLDGVAGTRLGGRMYGASAGPILELSELAHPRIGASVGVWAFFGVAPFARMGVVGDLGPFVEVGVHLSLPVFRR